MAISINWATRVITVPRADMPVTQVSPEIRSLDLDWFRLALKDLEDDEAGQPHPDTHRHNTTVTLSGVTYARTIEIINGYTVEFEDGTYAVSMAGANSNVLDVKVANQVSLLGNNSAGLVVVDSGGSGGVVSIDYDRIRREAGQEIIPHVWAADTPGPAGVDGGSYTHDQMVSASVWVVVHNLGYNPAVTCVDSGGTNVEGHVEYDTVNQLTITFTSAFAGFAYCS